MLPGLDVGEDPGSRALHILEPIQGFGRETGQDSIAVVQAGGDEGMDEGLSHRFREGGPESGEVTDGVESGLTAVTILTCSLRSPGNIYSLPQPEVEFGKEKLLG